MTTRTFTPEEIAGFVSRCRAVLSPRDHMTSTETHKALDIITYLLPYMERERVMREALEKFPAGADYANAEQFRMACNIWWNQDAKVALAGKVQP